MPAILGFFILGVMSFLTTATALDINGRPGLASTREDTIRSHPNTVDTIIDDMSLSNDAVLLGIPGYAWATNAVPAQIAMGTDTRGCKAPPWWQQSSALPEHKSCVPWRAFVQWFVVYEGEGNRAENVRVEVRDPRSWYLSRRTKRWMPLVENPHTSWFLAAKENVVWVEGDVDVKTLTDDPLEMAVVSMRVERHAAHAYHGIVGEGPSDVSEKLADLAAVFTTAQARLVGDDANAPEDLAAAVWLLQSGADWYPSASTHPHDAVPPGVGLSRSKRLTSEWQAFNFATLDTARQDYEGASRAITAKDLRENPPPL